MMQDKIKPELSGQPSTRISGIFSIFHCLAPMGIRGAWIVLSVALLLTFTAWYFARTEATKRDHARFNFRVETIEKGIYERLQAYEFLLQGGSGLFSTTNEVTRDDWRTYVTKLQINQYYPGIQGVGFSKRILPSDKDAHIRQIRSEGFPKYTINPAGDRPEYTSIIFLEPFDWRNQRAFGYDMFSEPIRKEAMIRARETGNAALSGKVTLVQETDKDKQAGFLIYQAIYRKGEPNDTPEQKRKALMGYVYSPFRMNEFIKGILAEKKGYIELQIFDGDKPLKENLLYQSDSAEEPFNYAEGRHFATDQVVMEYASHRWLLSFVSSKYFEKNISTGNSNFILWLGITISLLLFGMLLSLAKSYSQAINLANTTVNLKKANIELRKEIMEREQTEMALHKSEQRYKSAQRMGQVGNWEYDLVTENFWASDETKRIYGFNPESKNFTTAEVENCIPDRERIHQALIDLIENDTPYELEFEIHPVSGPKQKFIRSIAGLQKDDSGKPYKVTGVIQDITQQKEEESEKRLLQMKLQQAQKMESIGTLAGGIAHDFNNLLYPIIGFAEMLKEDLPQDSPEHESAQEIFNAGRRGGELVKQILAFSRQSEHKLSPVRFQKILTEVCKLIRSTIPSDIEIHQDIQKDCGLIMAEATQLHQIAMNLITNAYHAVEKTSGEISIQLKEIILDSDDLNDSPLQSGQYVMLSVSDNGVGIPRKIMNNIFEPYFTTKENGKGTGLGLAVVYGILTEHKGDIKVYSEEGKGTTFNVYLPLMKKSTEGISTEKALSKLTGTERILLVDDEESVVRLEKQMLERLGYDVSARSDSLEALETFNSNPDGYDLVISDMTMPNMTGDQLAQELMSIRPDIPIVICTGFSERINKEQAEANKVKGFLMKPVVKSDLALMVRKVLDEAKNL